MKIGSVNDIANLIAAVGVVLSLLFVAYEVRQNTDESRAANEHMVVASLREQLLIRAQSPSLGAAVGAARSGKQMTIEQDSQYTAYLFAQIKSVEEAFTQYVDGALDEEYFNTRLAGMMIPDFLGNEIGRSLYEGLRASGQITEEFGQAVDARLAERFGEAP
jgi:hypothetical protein